MLTAGSFRSALRVYPPDSSSHRARQRKRGGRAVNDVVTVVASTVVKIVAGTRRLRRQVTKAATAREIRPDLPVVRRLAPIVRCLSPCW
jgi:hypothetical protein